MSLAVSLIKLTDLLKKFEAFENDGKGFKISLFKPFIFNARVRFFIKKALDPMSRFEVY